MVPSTGSGGLRRPRSYYEAKNVAYRVWAVVGCVVVAACAVWALGLVAPAVKLLLVGLVAGFFASAPTNWLEDRGLPRGVAAALSMLAIVGCVMLVVGLVMPSLVDQLVRLLTRLPGYVYEASGSVEDALERFGDSLNPSTRAAISSLTRDLSSSAASSARSLMVRLSSGVVVSLFAFASDMVTLSLGLVLAFWFARDYPVILRELATIAGPDHEQELMVFLAVLSRSVSGYTRSTLYTATLAGVLSFGGYVLAGHPYAAIAGIAMGLFHIIPVVGVWAAAFLAVALAVFTSPALAVWTLLVAVVAMNVTDNLVGPIIVKSTVQVHPVLSFVAISCGQALAGIPGMIVAVPLCAALKGGFIYFFERRTGRQIVSYDGVLFQSTPFTDSEGEPVPSYDALDDDRFFTSTRLVSGERAPEATPAAPDGDSAGGERR